MIASPDMSSKPGEPNLRVGIVGTGAAGLATLMIISESPQVQSGQWTSTVTAFEARKDVGGI